MKMAVYKDKKRGTWYVSLYYTDWTGKQQEKTKRCTFKKYKERRGCS